MEKNSTKWKYAFLISTAISIVVVAFLIYCIFDLSITITDISGENSPLLSFVQNKFDILIFGFFSLIGIAVSGAFVILLIQKLLQHIAGLFGRSFGFGKNTRKLTKLENDLLFQVFYKMKKEGKFSDAELKIYNSIVDEYRRIVN